jgi:hypothetical protein
MLFSYLKNLTPGYQKWIIPKNMLLFFLIKKRTSKKMNNLQSLYGHQAALIEEEFDELSVSP